MSDDEQRSGAGARRWPWLVTLLVVVLAGVGVYLALRSGGDETPPPATNGVPTPTWPVSEEEAEESPEASVTEEAPTTPDQEVTLPGLPTLPPATDEPASVLEGLDAPWDLAFLPSGAFLVTARDQATVLLVDEQGATVLTGPGADELVATTVTDGEGGLLGVAVGPQPAAVTPTIHLYRTTAGGNEVVSATVDLISGTLGELEPVLTGIPAGQVHNGGRIAFGPDEALYVGTGDAGQADLAQDPGSLAGKILRITATGEAATGNPVNGSPVWSTGHRNVQGLAWDGGGRLYAADIGQDLADELNVIVGSGNYGWPVVEGPGGAELGFIDPIAWWAPAEATPSGIAYADGAVHLAGLRGSQLWSVQVVAGMAREQTASLDLGRLRTVVVGPDGALWILTNNTDGRGEPREGDDRLVRVAVPTG